MPIRYKRKASSDAQHARGRLVSCSLLWRLKIASVAPLGGSLGRVPRFSRNLLKLRTQTRRLWVSLTLISPAQGIAAQIRNVQDQDVGSG